MSGKYKNNNKFFLMKEKYMANCKQIGHSEEMALEVWRQMESFAGYSFNKAHSASFAVESIRRWWRSMGVPLYPAADRLLICADAGGGR